MDLPKATEKPTKQENENPINVLRDQNEEENIIEGEEGSESSQVEVQKMRVVDYLKKSLCPSTSTSLSQKGIKKIGNTDFFFDGQILFPKVYQLTGQPKRSGWKFLYPYEWSSILPAQNTLSNEIAPYVSGTIGAAREIETELSAFEIYVTEKMLQTILAHTNDEIQISQYYIFPNPGDVSLSSITELKALIGILFLSGLKKDSITPLSYQWSLSVNDIYNTVMSKERFEYLVRSLRFDEYTTRSMRRKYDPFAEIRGIWKEFITKCSEIFRPSLNCTIDEMFVDFNGNCSFRLPLPKQPRKHGIKLILLCDSKNHYIMSGIPYLEKSEHVTVRIAENIVEELARSIRGTNIKVTYAKDWFNSVSLSRKMLRAYRLSTVGALRKDHQEIPVDMITTEGRPVGSSILVYNREDKLQLCTRCRREGEVQILLSNINFESMIKNGKPYIIKYYNSFRHGVDTINKKCRSCSCSRQTTHWFIAIFYTILDFAGINALTILNLNRSRYGKPALRRNDFINKLALDLMLPYMKERLNDQTVNESVKNKIRCIIEEHENYIDFVNSPPKQPVEPTKKIYPANQVPQLNQPVAPDLTPKEKPPIDPKHSVHRTKEMYPVNRIDNLEQPVTPDLKTKQNYSTILKKEVKHCEMPSEQATSNHNNIWEIKARYPPSKANKPNKPVTPGWHAEQSATNITVRLFQATYPPMQPGIGTQTTMPYLNLGWTQPNFVLQQIQTFYTPDLPISRVTPILPKNLAAQQIQDTYQTSQPVKPIQPITSTSNNQLNPPRPILQRMQVTYQNSQSVKLLQSSEENTPQNPPRPIVQQMQATYLHSQSVKVLQSAEVNAQQNPPRDIHQQIQTTYPNSQSVRLLQSSEVNIQQNPPRPILQRMQATYQHSQSVNVLQSSHMNTQQNPVQVNTFPMSQPAISAQQGTSVFNTPQNSPQGTLQYNMQATYQNDQPTQPVMSIFNANQNPRQITGQLPSQFNLLIQTTSDPPRRIRLKKELCACGVCDSIGNKEFYVECSKCSVLLCIVHRKVQCTDCTNSSQSISSYKYVVESKKGKCGLCSPHGLSKFSVQCCRCLKFVCLEHRRMLCCFCTEW